MLYTVLDFAVRADAGRRGGLADPALAINCSNWAAAVEER